MSTSVKRNSNSLSWFVVVVAGLVVLAVVWGLELFPRLDAGQRVKELEFNQDVRLRPMGFCQAAKADQRRIAEGLHDIVVDAATAGRVELKVASFEGTAHRSVSSTFLFVAVISAGWAQAKNVLWNNPGVVEIAKTREWLHLAHVDDTVGDDALVDMNTDYLADHHVLPAAVARIR